MFKMTACAGAIQGQQIARGHASFIFIFHCEVARVESLQVIKTNVDSWSQYGGVVFKARSIFSAYSK
jgi:hypothetical protein